MSDEQFPAPKGQFVEDSIVDVPETPEVVDDLFVRDGDNEGEGAPSSAVNEHAASADESEVEAGIQGAQEQGVEGIAVGEPSTSESVEDLRPREQSEGGHPVRILNDALDAAKNSSLPSRELVDYLKNELERARNSAPEYFDNIPEAGRLERVIQHLRTENPIEEVLRGENQESASSEEGALPGEVVNEQGIHESISVATQGQRPGFFSRVRESLGRIRKSFAERTTRFIHGDTLNINSTIAAANLDRTPREPAYPEQENPAENSAAWSGDEAQEIAQPVQQPEATSESPKAEPAPVTEEVTSGPGFSSAEPEASASPEEVPAAPAVVAENEPVPAEQAEPSPSVVERVLESGARVLDSEKTPEAKKTPEEIAFDAAVDFTEKAERFISGMSALDYSKGYEAFAEKMSELLAPPEGVNPGDFALTQDRIMYRIARDESFPKEARQLLVQLLEKRGAVKVEGRGDGKKVIRRLVSYGEAAKEVIRDAKTSERRAARAEFARKQGEI